MDDGQKVITIAHPEHSSGELKQEKKKKKRHFLYINLLFKYSVQQQKNTIVRRQRSSPERADRIKNNL